MKYSIPISVVIPCFNAQNFIASAISSILTQSFTNFELIIINDGSSDNTHDEINQFSDHRITYIQNPKNQGNYVARNIGINISKGKYICMMDADDMSCPDRLKIQYQFMEKHPKIGIIGTLSEIIDKNNNPIGLINRPLGTADIKVNLLIDNYLTQSTLMIRSNLIKKHHMLYDESFKYTGDYDFIVRCAKKHKLRNLNQYLIKYRVHDSQISQAKHAEQMALADKVRLDQLKDFDIKICDDEKALHLKLVHYEHLSNEELLAAGIWLNKLLEANSFQKIYNQSLLFRLFKDLPLRAIRKRNQYTTQRQGQ